MILFLHFELIFTSWIKCVHKCGDTNTATEGKKEGERERERESYPVGDMLWLGANKRPITQLTTARSL